MPGKYPYAVMSIYPNIEGEYKEVWNRFIRKYPDCFDTVDYAVKVEAHVKIPSDFDTKTADFWSNLTKNTIDVIGWKKNSATIIEVKLRLGLATLGQVLGYRFLFHHEYPDVLLKPPLIVCSFINQYDSDVLDNYGILHEVV